MELDYEPVGRNGYCVTLVDGSTERLRIDAVVQPENAGLEQFVVGVKGLGDNETLVRHAEAFGSNEFSARRLRADEKRESHRRQAVKHKRAAEAIARLVPLITDVARVGWCSACLSRASHGRVEARRGIGGTFLCGRCGAPTARCLAPRCEHMAALGDDVARTPRYCAAHRHEVPGFNKLASRLASLDDYEDWLTFEEPDLSQRTKLAAGVVLGLAVVGPAAAVAAPAVGGAVGSFTGLSGAAATSHGLALLGGGSLAAGGFGMAGGVAVVSAVGAGLGGAAGASVAAAYVGADGSFRLEKLRAGQGPVVLFASGFLSQGKDGWDGWERILTERYPDSTVYRVHWGAKELRALAHFVGGEAIRRVGSKAVRTAARKASKAAATKVGPLAGLPMFKALLANPWSAARARAEMTGAVLADLVARTDESDFVLAGHSLGGRVMFNALRTLGTIEQTPKIREAHLLGAAVSQGEDWRTVDAAVAGKVFNYWSRNDAVLGNGYRAVSLNGRAIGQVGAGSKFPAVVDRNVSRSVTTHFDYTRRVRLR